MGDEMSGSNQVSIIIQLEDGTEKHIIISSVSLGPAGGSEPASNSSWSFVEENCTTTDTSEHCFISE